MEVIEKNNPGQPQTPAAQIALPNSQGALILGIFSLVTTFCCGGLGIVGLVLGIVAVVFGSKAAELYRQTPSSYTEASYKNANAGKICGIIGIIFNGIMIVGLIIYMVIVGVGLGALFSTFPWENFIN